MPTARVTMIRLTMALVLGTAACAALADGVTREGTTFQGRQARISANADGSFRLAYDGGTRDIAAQAWKTTTASPLFDGLFAMAQADLAADSVKAISDSGFDHGQPIACDCFVTGEKWPFVWTRDLSFSVDLGLWRFDPQRARNSFAFKISGVRQPGAGDGTYVMQDTGSGGSWPISTDRVVWFTGAQHLLSDKAFAARYDKALADTLAQDRSFAFDSRLGLYRGETSFLDWREQTYPAWTKEDVTFIAESFALSTNVLHYQALRIAASRLHDGTDYAGQAAALKAAINHRFWRDDRGMYMSYIGGDVEPAPFDTYDMLGLALAIDSGVADTAHAKKILANYPVWPAGTPVIWPERRDQPIYHNRAIWPFVSAYALRAARRADAPAHIEHEIRSLMQGAALSGSNMENFELASQKIHVDEGPLSGPVVDSPRQLWSVGAYLGMVTEGVFGLEPDDTIVPKLPVGLARDLFGDNDTIALDTGARRIVLHKPAGMEGNLLVADKRKTSGRTTDIWLKATAVPEVPLRKDAPLYAPAAPNAPVIASHGGSDSVKLPADGVLYVNGQRTTATTLPHRATVQCVSVTVEQHGLESLHSPTRCVGEVQSLQGEGPWTFTPSHEGPVQLRLSYENDNGPVNTGVTAAVRRAQMQCEGAPVQVQVIVMPHGIRRQVSTPARFNVPAHGSCTISLKPGFNMSYLTQFAHYTQAKGGASGPLDTARVFGASVMPLP
ncbi:Six-hairpin glycosidase-like protein [Pinirhizobacter sp.]|uniref:Six-hairpin glycosidase-like protein n=1 Tax=Pinirhizobacter sp. TaxID=2950432 RepID=UPI002F3F8F3B